MKLLPIVFSFLIWLFGSSLKAFENYSGGTRSIGLSGCGVAISDIWSVANNQAGMVYLTKSSIAFHHQQQFLLKELGITSMVWALPLKNSALGVQLVYTGYSKYHEMKSGIAYAHQLGNKLSFGIQLDYFSLFVPAYDNLIQQITFEAGLLSEPFDNFKLGFHVFNPLPEKWRQNKMANLPVYASFGFSYLWVNKLLFNCETLYNYIESPILRLGVEVSPIDLLQLRLGISSGMIPYSFGLSYQLKKLKAGFAYSFHEKLGTSPSLDLIYVW